MRSAVSLGADWRPFSELMERVERKTDIDDLRSYHTVGVRWYGEGPFVRERLDGSEIAQKRQGVIRTGDVVYNKLFAWKGSFAVADDSVDGMLISNEFPTYRLRSEGVHPAYLQHCFRS